MNSEQTYERYLRLFNDLKGIITKTQERLIQEQPDPFFVDHTNFFIKSFLISVCTYLEAFLKDMAIEHVNRINQKITVANIPHNIVVWAINASVKEQDLAYRQFNLPLSKKDIDDELSGNPFRTSKTFRYIGVDLESNDCFKKNKELVNTVIAKRNSIIHHNDDALDISLGDILSYIDTFIEYTKNIEQTVVNSAS